MKLKTNIRYLTHISPPVNAAIAAVCPHTHNTEWKSKDPSVSRCLTGARACGCVWLYARVNECVARARKTHDRHTLTASFLLPKINFAIVCSVRQNRSCQRSNTFCINQVAIFGGLMKIAHTIYFVTLVRDVRGIFFEPFILSQDPLSQYSLGITSCWNDVTAVSAESRGFFHWSVLSSEASLNSFTETLQIDHYVIVNFFFFYDTLFNITFLTFYSSSYLIEPNSFFILKIRKTTSEAPQQLSLTHSSHTHDCIIQNYIIIRVICIHTRFISDGWRSGCANIHKCIHI